MIYNVKSLCTACSVYCLVIEAMLLNNAEIICKYFVETRGSKMYFHKKFVKFTIGTYLEELLSLKLK